ncbi:hypothetical protein HK405_011443, partial [Cladochytrium tenue]
AGFSAALRPRAKSSVLPAPAGQTTMADSGGSAAPSPKTPVRPLREVAPPAGPGNAGAAITPTPNTSQAGGRIGLAPGSATKAWYEKIAEALIGDSEGPHQKYALICQNCFTHNGLVMPEEYATIRFRCMKCGFVNAKQRRDNIVQTSLSPPTSPAPSTRLLGPAAASGSDDDRLRHRYSAASLASRPSTEFDYGGAINPRAPAAAPLDYLPAPAPADANNADDAARPDPGSRADPDAAASGDSDSGRAPGSAAALPLQPFLVQADDFIDPPAPDAAAALGTTEDGEVPAAAVPVPVVEVTAPGESDGAVMDAAGAEAGAGVP